MRKHFFTTLLLMLSLAPMIQAASKPHVVTLGKTTTVKLFVGPDESKSVDLKIRSLYVDGKLKDFTTGESHDITDQQFTVQRAYRVNDSLPQDERNLPKWKWQRGGWLLVDRVSGHITKLTLPDFDPFYSEVVWYRDYAAYCGTPDGEKLYALVLQIGVRKPMLRRVLRATDPTAAESNCGRPSWERQPSRVTFDLKEGQKLTFTVRGRATDLLSPETQTSDDEN